MIYPENYENKVGFNDIRTLLCGFCQSELGKERVADLQMFTEIGAIRQRLSEAQELETILEETVELPEMFFHDLRPAIQRIRLEGTHIEEEDLSKLKQSLDTLHSWLKIIRSTEEDTNNALYPALNQLSMGVFTFLAVAATIDKTLDRYGKIKDEASPELARIRSELRASEGSVNRTLHGILKIVKNEGLVPQDVTPTFREGRLVIPVSPSLKKRLRGIVHDESATGKTVFIEPQEVVEANNRIRELEAEERREIIQILKHITMLIRPNSQELLRAFIFLADLEFVRARVSFARHIGGIYPTVVPYPIIDWTLAQHPLLKLSLAKQGKKVVPLEIKLDRKQHILIISGPNAGGKSVCLKTVGLIQYMLQCGLPVPVGECSKMGVFCHLAIDIGDEQSIEDDLSTYSSHLLNMKNMMKMADSSTLLLIDEFGGGTEPTIGGAMAEAILMRYTSNGAFGVITTHYQNLKHFADAHDGVANGAMLYDRQRMQALFQLQIGNPGSSFAIEIARKIGIPEDVIADATNIVGKDYVNADKYLLDIVRDKRYWENKRQTIHSQEKQMELAIRKYEQEIEELKQKRKEIIQSARQQAEEIIQNSNAVVENTIREIREAQAEKERTKEIRNELNEFRNQLEQATRSEYDEMIERKMRQIQERKKRQEDRKRDKNEKAIREAQRPAIGTLLSALGAKPQSTEGLAIGMPVKIIGTTAIGTVEKINGKRITVQFGMVRSVMDAQKLVPAKPEKKEKKQAFQVATYMSQETQDRIRETHLNFHSEIDIRGMRGEEALETITHYIDDAILVGASRVRILHGTGNGILRQLIRKYLHTVPQVISARDEDVRFGGAGITVVSIK
ncbi:MAG: Smr/MutS family protein [Bacteroides sp.]|nr:Smr/MutS family protein [Bacteroides sp.]MCM1446743.1 Smr/MutS family protein [Bacteroides sp.]